MHIKTYKVFEEGFNTEAPLYKVGDRLLILTGHTYYYRKKGESGMFSTWRATANQVKDTMAMVEIEQISAPFSKVRPESLKDKQIMYRVKILLIDMFVGMRAEIDKIINTHGAFEEYSVEKTYHKTPLASNVDFLWAPEKALIDCPDWLSDAYEKHKNENVLKRWGNLYELSKGETYYKIIETRGEKPKIEKQQSSGVLLGTGGGFCFGEMIRTRFKYPLIAVIIPGTSGSLSLFDPNSMKKGDESLANHSTDLAESIADASGFKFTQDNDKEWPMIFNAYQLKLVADNQLMDIDCNLNSKENAEELRKTILDEIKNNLNHIIEYYQEDSVEVNRYGLRVADLPDLIAMAKNSSLDIDKIKKDNRGNALLRDLGL